MKVRSTYHVIPKIDAVSFMRKQHDKIDTDISRTYFDEMKKYFSKGLKQAAGKK
jgi:hypothetical protein